MKYFVIAGNSIEYGNFIKKHVTERFTNGDDTASLTDYMFVRGPGTFAGQSNPHGWFVGTWHERSDIREILEAMAPRYHNEKVPESVINAWHRIT